MNYLVECLILYVISCVSGQVGHGGSESGSFPGSGASDQCEEGSQCSLDSVNLVRLDPVKAGHVEELDIVPGRPLHMTTISTKPALFEIAHFLSDEECDHLIALAKKQGLRESETYMEPDSNRKGLVVMDNNYDKRLSISEMRLTLENSYDIYFTNDDVLKMYKDLKLDTNGDTFLTPNELDKISPSQLTNFLRKFIGENPVKKSRMSRQVWLFPDEHNDEQFQAISERVRRLTKLPGVLVQKSDVQVVNYGMEGHYNAHWDSSPLSDDVTCCTRKHKHGCRICRFMTVLFYLNDVEKGGGTAFPVADNDTYDEHKFRESHHLNLQLHCDDSNVIVQPEKGKAVMWYNHQVSHEGWMGDMDAYGWHGGCPVEKGHKWIANFWIKTSDNKKDDLIPH